MVRKIETFKVIEFLIITEFFHKRKMKIRLPPSKLPSGLFLSQAKVVTDGELIKSCLIGVAKEMCLEKINLFKTISLLVRTVVQS